MLQIILLNNTKHTHTFFRMCQRTGYILAYVQPLNLFPCVSRDIITNLCSNFKHCGLYSVFCGFYSSSFFLFVGAINSNKPWEKKHIRPYKHIHHSFINEILLKLETVEFPKETVHHTKIYSNGTDYETNMEYNITNG